MVMGTPSYVAPEQVQGRNRELGPPADVYALGAILYETLTGRPPLLGPTVLETFQLVLSHEPMPPRSLQPQVPRDLETICLKCLQKAPGRRYATARELAADLRRFLAGEPVRARRTPAWERALKWVRRRPTMAAGLAFGCVTAVGLLLAGAASLAESRRHRDRVASEIDRAIEWLDRARDTGGKEAESLASQAREATQRAVALVESRRVDARLQLRLNDLLARLDDEKKDRRLLETLEAGWFAPAYKTDRWSRSDLTSSLPFFRKALAEYGMAVGEMTAAEVAARLAQRAAGVRTALLAAIDVWVDIKVAGFSISQPDLDWLHGVLDAADPEESWQRKVRTLAARGSRARQRGALEKLAQEADVEHLPAQAVTSLAHRLRHRDGFAAAVTLLRRAQPFHAGDFWINYELGHAVLWRFEADHEGQVNIAGDPGIVLDPREKADIEESVRYHTAAVAARPDSAVARLQLGISLCAQRNFDQAIAEFRQAIRLDPGIGAAYSGLGAVLPRVDKRDEAVAALHTAITLEPGSAVNYCNLGATLRSQNKLEESIAALRRAIELDSRLASAHLELGLLLKAQDKRKEAIAEMNETLAIDPKHVDALVQLAHLWQLEGQLKKAIPLVRKAIDLNPRHAIAHLNLGAFQKMDGNISAAIASCRRAIELDPKLVFAHASLGIELFREGKLDLAAQVFRDEIVADPKYPWAHCLLGDVLRHQGKIDDAIACYRKTIALDSNHVVAHVNLAGVLSERKHDYDAAIAVCRKALEANHKHPGIHVNLGVAHYKLGKQEKAIAAFGQAVALDPKCAEAREAWAEVLLQQGRFREARDQLNTCRKLVGPGHPVFPEVRKALSHCDYYLTVEDKLPEMLAGTLEPESASGRLALAWLCVLRNHHLAAARLSADAFAAAPRLANDLEKGYRYMAAGCAVLAAAGQADDARVLPDRVAASLRKQALRWLRADLTRHVRQIDGNEKSREIAREKLIQWQTDPDLASVRDDSALALLDDDERGQWEGLWKDVGALLSKIRSKE
jgi:tetratricopeptide (TPR) repeat protein